MGRFILTLVPGLYNFKHMVYEKPEDIVAARRERNTRKDMLRKEVSRRFWSTGETSVRTSTTVSKRVQNLHPAHSRRELLARSMHRISDTQYFSIWSQIHRGFEVRSPNIEFLQAWSTEGCCSM